MRRPFIAVMIAVFLLVLPPVLQGQDFTGRIHITTHTLDVEGVMGLVGNDVGSIMDRSAAEIAAAPGVETENITAMVRGTIVKTAMDDAEFTIDYGADQYTMYDPTSDSYATWTGDELRQMISGMMGGMDRGSASDAMARARAAMGITDSDPEGPYELGNSGACGRWWGGNMGEVSFDSNPLQSAWIKHVCVSNNYPAAHQSLLAMQEALGQFDIMGLNGAESEMDNAIQEHGFPIVLKTLKKGGGMTPSLTFTLITNEVEPGPVSAAELEPHGTQVTLQQMMGRMMSGSRR